MNITFDDFAKLEIRIGKVLSAEKIEGTDKLLKFKVDFGSAEQNSSNKKSSVDQDLADKSNEIRQIVSGIAKYYTPEQLIGKEFPFIVNLEPRRIRGVESQGMIMAVVTESNIVLLNPDKEVPAGSKVR